ncbi:unnamed protein product [Rotaria magnacalcarata]|uniref:Uncharacterized protein n=1 Tax=Rotaria magnacalcarata TaxID=392030 RepID=A0A816V3E4_9BILA|nr:unnamed protein product [Rotaria magnacalcarata]CAF4462164.1 unnamed protein product [Rotaria magnacalcarata]
MTYIRNDGESKVDIENAELLGDDINLQMYQRSSAAYYTLANLADTEQAAGVHAFTINKPYSIDAKTNYLLSMFLTQAPINRYNFISKFFRGPENSTGKSKHLYRLVGKTSILDLAVESRHYFSIGEDADKIYKENETLVTSYYFNVTTSVYGIRQ